VTSHPVTSYLNSEKSFHATELWKTDLKSLH